MPPDTSSSSVVIDPERCILCGECVRTCREVQSVGAIEIGHTDGLTRVAAKDGACLSETACVGCGQCHATCPTGALRIKSDVERVREAIADDDTMVVVQLAPSVRVGVGGYLGFPKGENAMPLLIGAMRRLGFDKVFDTVISADLTVIEEANEFLERLSQNKRLPLLTSCCPAWVKFCEDRHPEFAPNISTCRSPQQMLGALIRAYYGESENSAGKRVVSVSIMPCTAKKAEILRPESMTRGVRDVDYSLTTSELLDMMEDAGLTAQACQPCDADMPFSAGSGSGTLFGTTGGVSEAVLRYLSPKLGFNNPDWITTSGVRGFDGIKQATVKHNGAHIRIAIVSGLGNADQLLKKIRAGDKRFDLIEVMACPGGCIMGGGQPSDVYELYKNRAQRGAALYSTDDSCTMKAAQENSHLQRIRQTLISGHEHELLHRNSSSIYRQ